MPMTDTAPQDPPLPALGWLHKSGSLMAADIYGSWVKEFPEIAGDLQPLCNRTDALRLVAELRQKQAWIDRVGPPLHPDDERHWVGAYLDAMRRAELAERRLAELERAQGWKPLDDSMPSTLAYRIGLVAVDVCKPDAKVGDEIDRGLLLIRLLRLRGLSVHVAAAPPAPGKGTT